MKRRLAAKDTIRPRFPRLHIPEADEESPADMDAGPSHVVGLMDLPSELKQAIFFSIPPAERHQLRRVNKTVMNAIDTSMRDVQEMAVSHTNEQLVQKATVVVGAHGTDAFGEQPGTSASSSSSSLTTKENLKQTKMGGCRVVMTTVNPYTGAKASFDYKIKPSALPHVLLWAGVRTESLSVTTTSCFSSNDNSRLDTVRRVMHALTTDDACPVLMQLSIKSCRLVFDNIAVLSDVLAYVSKRQLDAMAAVERTKPFLRTLSLIAPPNCCDERSLRMQSTTDGQSTAAAMDLMMFRQMQRIGGPAVATSGGVVQSAFSLFSFGRAHSVPAAPMPTPPLPVLHHFGSEDLDRLNEFYEDSEDGAPPPRPDPVNQAMRDLLQQILDQCNGLKVLSLDSLLKAKSLPVVAMQYPTTLTNLQSARLGKTIGELHTIALNCPNLQVVDELCGGFTRSEADVRALVSLSDLRSLSIVSAAAGEEMVRLADLSLQAFGEHPFGSQIVRPWAQITSIALNYATGVFLQLVSRGCPTLQEVRIQVLANTPAVTEQSVRFLIDLPALRVLIVEDKNEERPVMVGDSLLDAIAARCPDLEQLCLFPCSVALLSLPRLLRECPRLRLVTLRSLSIALETLDCLVMVRSIAVDLSERQVTSVIQVREITGEDYTSVGRIIDGLGHGTVMAMSSMTDSCVHDLEVCARCCFDAPEARANARRIDLGGRDTCPRSFILARRLRPNAAIVFSAPPTFKPGSESGRRP